MVDRQKLRSKAKSAGKSIAGTLSSAGSRAAKAGKHVAKTTKKGAKRIGEDLSAGQGAGGARPRGSSKRRIYVRYSSENDGWVVEGPTAGFGVYDTKEGAMKVAKEKYEQKDLYEGIQVETKKGAIQEDRSIGQYIEEVERPENTQQGTNTGGFGGFFSGGRGRSSGTEEETDEESGSGPQLPFMGEQGGGGPQLPFGSGSSGQGPQMPDFGGTGGQRETTSTSRNGRAETVTSRQTDEGQTLVLKRRKSDRFQGTQYEYFVTERGSNQRIDQYVRTRQQGMQQLRESVQSYNVADQSEGGGMGFGFSPQSGGPSMPDFGGGGSPSVPDDLSGQDGGPGLPGFGMGSDDDDGPSVPDFGMEPDDDDVDSWFY